MSLGAFASTSGPRPPQLGELLVVGFEGLEADASLLDFLARESISGVILFRRNVRDAAQVARLVRRLREAAPRLLVGIDEEGGKVRRLSADFTTFPSMDLLGRIGSEELVRELARAMAVELRAIGVNWDYAPVLDVHSNAANPIIGTRAFSSDPAVVARLGAAFIETLQAAGVAACGKHFPGHGDTSLDSHLALPAVEVAREVLEARELVPFRAAVRAGLASMMTAHVRYPSLDAERTATLSPTILGGLLRGELGFGGVVVTDDLEMRAVADHATPEALAVASLQAGADVLLACKSREVQERVLAGVRAGLAAGAVSEERLAESVARVRALAERFAIDPAAVDEPSAVAAAGLARPLVERIETLARA
ncbi:MAG: beta-N-acetylhexosaminidase [Deltaproteobacteria bacterium]|nr:beta-N-acetylhexosaminidase [Deltaproteobacteria bacterium]